MTGESFVLLTLQVVGPAVAAYLSVKVGIAVAMERADQAKASAQRAHERIDNLMERRA